MVSLGRKPHSSPTGLGNGDMEHKSNRAALEETLAYLAKDPVDSVRVQLARSLADAVDHFPKNAQLWRVYREAVEALYAHDDRASDELEKALAEIASAAPVRHSAEA